MITTVQMESETRARLAELKASPRETYDEVLKKLLALVPTGDEEGRYTAAFRVGLLNARLDIREGRVVEHAVLKRRLGL
ncbi:MAG TPA: hypothetical protein VFG07_10505 [Thermoplasmata archaeon]|nr:hypothetical protein [Thermoplasmata archaeon]